MKGPDWSDEEKALLASVIRKGRPLIESVDLFPGRTYKSISNKAWRRAHERATSKTVSIRALMRDGVARSAKEIAALCDTDAKYVRAFMRRATDPDARQEMHIARYDAKRKTRIFAFGPGENAACPDMKDQHRASPAADLDELSDEELDARYRAKAKWWPAADMVVVSAMTAMVQAGRAGA